MKNRKTKILLVEDDKNLGTILKEYLVVKGFEVVHSFNGEEGLNEFKNDNYDICLLDVMMPKVDGFTFARKIQNQSDVPFIFVTAKSLIEDKIEGFKIGADDYIVKPFSMEELILRINAVLKRKGKPNHENDRREFQLGNYIFNYENRLLKLNKDEQKLTSREAELLYLLCRNQNELMQRSTALSTIWKNETYFTSRSMDVYITKLRGYLKNDPNIKILNIHGTGYKLIVDEAV
jgi:DNA-binding response OmpR family regulator